MPLDWFTFVAQAINFLILVWLLKRFLFKPILQAIDEREKGIAARLAQAETQQAKAQNEREVFQHKNLDFDQQRAALLKKAKDEAAAERQRLLDEARKDADSLRAKRQEALRNEQQNLSQEIVRRTQKEVFAIARKTLADLAATSLEQRMGEVFVQRLRAIAGPAKEQWIAALKAAPQPPRVRSAFDLPRTLRSAIESTVKELFQSESPLQFETAPGLVSGIELSASGQKVCWNIAEYLATLEKSTAELLQRNLKPGAEPTPENKLKGDPEPKREVAPPLELAPSAPRGEP